MPGETRSHRADAGREAAPRLRRLELPHQGLTSRLVCCEVHSVLQAPHSPDKKTEAQEAQRQARVTREASRAGTRALGSSKPCGGAERTVR